MSRLFGYLDFGPLGECEVEVEYDYQPPEPDVGEYGGLVPTKVTMVINGDGLDITSKCQQGPLYEFVADMCWEHEHYYEDCRA